MYLATLDVNESLSSRDGFTQLSAMLSGFALAALGIRMSFLSGKGWSTMGTEKLRSVIHHPSMSSRAASLSGLL